MTQDSKPKHRVQGFIAAFSKAQGRTPAAASQKAVDYLLREKGDPAKPLISNGEFGPTEFERLAAQDDQGFYVPIALAEKWLGHQVLAHSALRGGDPSAVLEYKSSYYYGGWWGANYPLQDPSSETPGTPWEKEFDGVTFAFEAVLRIDLES